jgi:hypothetical protein
MRQIEDEAAAYEAHEHTDNHKSNEGDKPSLNYMMAAHYAAELLLQFERRGDRCASVTGEYGPQTVCFTPLVKCAVNITCDHAPPPVWLMASAGMVNPTHYLQPSADFWKGWNSYPTPFKQYNLFSAGSLLPIPHNTKFLGEGGSGLTTKSVGPDGKVTKKRTPAARIRDAIDRRRAKWGKRYAFEFANAFIARLKAQGRVHAYFSADATALAREMGHAVYRIFNANVPYRRLAPAVEDDDESGFPSDYYAATGQRTNEPGSPYDYAATGQRTNEEDEQDEDEEDEGTHEGAIEDEQEDEDEDGSDGSSST